ncbi:hypothetical protein O181_029433 [Austropuccinia psidii MF-1]|uniref:Uncharacterized protein n=1 Tax=Austropuccinia psidii MF-1 TaxID=1389203 RepID=A0A9Q3CVQ0_9BASI|nr:hypothetical protein [Austropuccinia psidii MF-1]
MEPDFKEGDQVLVSTLNFNNLKGQKKMRDSFVGPFTIIKLRGKNVSMTCTYQALGQSTCNHSLFKATTTLSTLHDKIIGPHQLKIS